MNDDKNIMSVYNNIRALALVNIQDIFKFTLTAKDSEIEKRYGSEEKALEVAKKYLNIALQASALNYGLSGWSLKYSQPITDSNDRRETTAYFHDIKSEDNT